MGAKAIPPASISALTARLVRCARGGNNAVGAKIKRCGTSGVYFAKSPDMDGFMAVGTDRVRLERVIPYYLCDIG